MDQAAGEVPFELGDVLADRRRRQAEASASFGKTLQFSDVAEHVECSQSIHRCSLLVNNMLPRLHIIVFK
ncbi:hypothetical protein D3C71_1997010 [compost metagenome]